MTRRRITTVEEADAADLGWLRKKGSPRLAVNDLSDCCAVYREEVYKLRAEIARLTGEPKRPGFADREDQRRK